MKRPLLLDLFCKAGGTSAGYHRAGFDVIGIDIKPQRHYPFPFIQADVMAGLPVDIAQFDAIAASPPCQAYVSLSKNRGYPDLIDTTRELLIATGIPYVIENVPGAPLRNAIKLCGTMFGLLVIRHRLFETSFEIPYFGHPSCNHVRKGIKLGRRPDRNKNYHCVVGNFNDVEFARIAMDINWMTQGELAQAIPPAYTEYVGGFLMQHIKDKNPHA